MESCEDVGSPKLNVSVQDGLSSPAKGVSTAIQDTPSSPPKGVSTAIQDAPSSPPKEISTAIQDTPSSPPKGISTAIQDTPSSPPKGISTAIQDTPSSPPKGISTAIQDTPSSPPKGISTAIQDAPSSPSKKVSTAIQDTPSSPSKKVSTAIQDTPSSPPKKVSTAIQDTPSSPPKKVSTAIQDTPYPSLKGTSSKERRVKKGLAAADKSFEEELSRRIAEIQLVKESLAANSERKKNKRKRHKNRNLDKKVSGDKVETEVIGNESELNTAPILLDTNGKSGNRYDSDTESCDSREDSEDAVLLCSKQKVNVLREKRSKKKGSTPHSPFSKRDLSEKGKREKPLKELASKSDGSASRKSSLQKNGAKPSEIRKTDWRNTKCKVEPLAPSKGNNLKKKVRDDFVGSKERAVKVVSTKAKTEEIKGSYSQLLQSVDEPLLYRPAEEIASLLSPMAHRAGPNHRSYQLGRNCDNWSYNRSNQGSTFDRNIPYQIPNGNLGHSPHNQSPAKKTPNLGQSPKNNSLFDEHWQVKPQTFQNDNLIVGIIRVNPKDYTDCYVPHPDGHSDVYICGTKNRNRALNGDHVLVLLDERSKWKVNKEELDSDFTSGSEECEGNEQALSNGGQLDRDPSSTDSKDGTSPISCSPKAAVFHRSVPTSISHDSSDDTGALANVDVNLKRSSQKKETPNKKYTSIADMNRDSNLQRVLDDKKGENMSHKYIQRTGKVVDIIEKKNPRRCTGHLALMNGKKVRFNPIDSRLPRITIPFSECPKEFLHRPEDYSKVLYVAKITDWCANDMFATGSLLKSLGEAGEIETETEGILIENDIDASEFPDMALESLPIDRDQPWTISDEEFSKRRDFTKKCVFTIDPASARDLDDAVSCEILAGGLYEVGVHIADVTYFLREGSQLDDIAASRATSVYMVQKVIPMLPRILCEKLCSLNPNEARLTFSVVWHMNEKGEVVHEWFGRSVIKSCAKLSYDHAQGFIDTPSRDYTEEQLPQIYSHSVNDVKSRVLILHKLASFMRQRRFDEGALRLDQIKLQWVLNGDNGLPTGYFVYEQRDSNRLIEEFMLLANMAVAHRIHASLPGKCLLRRHPEPQTRMIDNLNDFCKSLDIPIDISSAGAIHRSLLKYTDNDEYSVDRLQVLVSMCSKPMKLAKYFCTGMLQDESEYRHYALNVPLYTHFTSPIRRYADVLVHRSLTAALGYTADTKLGVLEMERQAEHCNDKKTASKRAQELSSEIFFAAFVKEIGPLQEKGMVMAVLDHSFDVFILKFGIIKRVYCNKLNLKEHISFKKKKIPVLQLHWKEREKVPESVSQDISIFTLVTCILSSDPEPLRWSAVIKHPRL